MVKTNIIIIKSNAQKTLVNTAYVANNRDCVDIGKLPLCIYTVLAHTQPGGSRRASHVIKGVCVPLVLQHAISVTRSFYSFMPEASFSC